jgi:hypothetical protein
MTKKYASLLLRAGEQRKGYRSFRKTPPPKLSEYGSAYVSPSADGRSGELRGIWGGSLALFV